ncbi:MAG: hypothetical protein J7J57_03810 [Caldisericaceae bacterium]|nr:hypothetical protein [Caldisericaceae bacterium]RLD19560.1 MAG: amidinotransferase [Caldisericota bacterium]
MAKNKGNKLTEAIISTPIHEYFHVKNLGRHNITLLPDKNKAIKQHNELKKTMQNFECHIIDVKELKGHPNSVFVKDTAICTSNGYIKLRMGLASRRGEEQWISKTLESLNIPLIASLKEPATAEGGDVVLAGKIAFIGHSSRTNKEGTTAISRILSNMGYKTRIANVPLPFLHIGGAMTALDSNCIVHCKQVFPDDFFKDFKEIEVPCNTFISGNVINLGKNEVIAEASNTLLIRTLQKNGYIVHSIDLSEYVKGTGGPSCLVLPVKRE